METKRKDCRRCNGKGYIELYSYNGGLCLACRGRGEILTKEQSEAEAKAMWEKNTREQAETAVNGMRATYRNKDSAVRALMWLTKLAELDREKAEQLFKSLPEDRQALIRAERKA